jgi:hypothetical protein
VPKATRRSMLKSQTNLRFSCIENSFSNLSGFIGITPYRASTETDRTGRLFVEQDSIVRNGLGNLMASHPESHLIDHVTDNVIRVLWKYQSAMGMSRKFGQSKN